MMKKFSFSLLSVLFASLALADSNGIDKNYCSNALDSNGRLNNIFFQNKIQDASTTQLSFTNQGGLGGAGVCWWHSRFTRNALYLGVFRPELAKLSHDQNVDSIHQIMDGSAVVEIHGYNNLTEFSSDYANDIEATLENAQMGTAFGFGWLNGLAGGHTEDPSALQDTMDKLYDEVTSAHKVPYQMLKMPGVEAHAWLVVGMQKDGNSYNLQVVDSNAPGSIQPWTFTSGMSSMGSYYSGPEFTPYTEEEGKFDDYQDAIRDYCNSDSYQTHSASNTPVKKPWSSK